MAIPVLSNDNVISLWAEGHEARNHKNTLKAIDGDLFSYNLKIGHRTESGGGSYHSQTTSCHVGRAKRHADMVMHPMVWATSPLSKEEAPF